MEKSINGKYCNYKTLIEEKPKIEELQVTGEWRKNKWGNIVIICKCSCGNIVDKYFSDLNSTKKRVLSCGCKHKELVKKIGEANKKYYLNEDKLTDNNITSYIIGLLAADGYHTKNNVIGISLQEEDGYLIEQIAKYLEWTGSVNIKKPGKNSKTKKNHVRIHICDQQWRKFCNDRGIIKNKTREYIVPEQYIYDRHYWRGMIDGDGCLFDYPNKEKYVKYGVTLCGTKNTVESFKKYCAKVTGSKMKMKVYEKPGVYTITIVGKQAIQVLEDIYKNIDNEIYMKRKYITYTTLIEKYKGKRTQNHIGKYNKEGNLIERYESIKEACEVNHINRGNLISVCIENKNNSKNRACRGWIYRYIPQTI